MGDEALLPLAPVPQRRVRDRVGAVARSSAWACSAASPSIPLYLQIVKGASPTKAGLLILPLVAGIMAASLLSGQVTSRTGRYKIFPVVGGALLVVGMLLLSQIGADTALWQTDLCMLVFGAGLGMNMQTHRAGHAERGATAGHGRRDLVHHVLPPGRRHARHGGLPVDPVHVRAVEHRRQPARTPACIRPDTKSFDLNDTSGLSSLPDKIKHPILVGFSDAMDTVFLVGACVLVVAFVLAIFMKEVPLRTVSGNQARADEARDAEASASSI